jgi:hypothetical protein
VFRAVRAHIGFVSSISLGRTASENRRRNPAAGSDRKRFVSRLLPSPEYMRMLLKPRYPVPRPPHHNGFVSHLHLPGKARRSRPVSFPGITWAAESSRSSTTPCRRRSSSWAIRPTRPSRCWTHYICGRL